MRATEPSMIYNERPLKAWPIGKLNLEIFVETINMKYYLLRDIGNAQADEYTSTGIHAIA